MILNSDVALLLDFMMQKVVRVKLFVYQIQISHYLICL